MKRLSKPSTKPAPQASEKALAAVLKAKRIAAGLTQWEVARELGYDTPQFVSNWERAISSPPMDVMPALARLYSIPARDFVQLICDYQLQKVEEHRRQLTKLFKG